jgi:hypothetical protein
MKKYRWLQKCMICNCEYKYESDKEVDEDRIRASCLPCGHQGLFTLKSIKNDNQN